MEICPTKALLLEWHEIIEDMPEELL